MVLLTQLGFSPNIEDWFGLKEYITKAWKDFRQTVDANKLPNGITLTILVCEEYRQDTRDDIAFGETVRAIYNRLSINDDIWKPYQPSENMRDYLSLPQFEIFMNELKYLISQADAALSEEDGEMSSQCWQKVLGDRFPVRSTPNSSSSSPKKFESPAILGTPVKSA